MGVTVCRLVVALVAFAGLGIAGSATAFPTQDDQTPGTLALGFRKRSNVWGRIDAGVLDGKVTTTPPDTTIYDRRLEVLVIGGGDGLLANRFAGRVNLKGETVKRRVSADDDVSPVTDESTSILSPSFDLTFITDRGLELFGGVEAKAFGAVTREETSANGKTTTEFDAATVLAKRFGVTRRAGRWSGGFYLVQGDEKERDVVTKVFDGSENSSTDTVFVPSRVGIFGEFAAGLTWDFDLAFVQARGMGPKDENGVTAYGDYFEARCGGFLALAGGLGVRGSVFHKTLSYAASSFVTFETIPITSVKGLVILGSESQHLFAGAVAGAGKDGQSLPEFNAKYDLLGVAATLGFTTPL